MSKSNRIYKIFMTTMIVAIAGMLLVMGIIAIHKSIKLNMSLAFLPGVNIEIWVKNDDIVDERLVFRNFEDSEASKSIEYNSLYCSITGNTLEMNNNFVDVFGNNFVLIIKNFSNIKLVASISSIATAKIGIEQVSGVNPVIIPETIEIIANESQEFVVTCEPIIPQETILKITLAEHLHEVTLNLNGGSYNDTYNDIVLSEKYTNLLYAANEISTFIPTLENHTFAGWYSDKLDAMELPSTEIKYFSCDYFLDNKISLVKNLQLTEPTTLYARWLPFEIGTYGVGADLPTEHEGEIQYNAFAGYKYLKFNGVDNYAYTNNDSSIVTSPLRFIVIGAGKNVNSVMKGAYEQTALTTSAFSGTLMNSRDTISIGTNREIADNHVLLLSEQILANILFCEGDADWNKSNLQIKEFLNGEFLTISNLDNYVDNGYIVLPSSNQSNDTLANGIKTAWSGGDGVDNTSRIFLLASRYGFTNKGKSSETGEVALNESSQAKYYSQHFAIEDYLGSSNTTYLLNGKLYNGGDMTCEDSKLKYFTGMGGYSFNWWLRSGDFDINYRTSAYSVGGVGYVGSYNANRSDLSLRPCFILNLA